MAETKPQPNRKQAVSKPGIRKMTPLTPANRMEVTPERQRASDGSCSHPYACSGPTPTTQPKPFGPPSPSIGYQPFEYPYFLYEYFPYP